MMHAYGPEFGIMGMAGVGFFGMLLIGFLAGWIAERAMNRDHGLLTNILVGIAGSFVGGTAAGVLGFQWYGFFGNLVVATLGAIAILWFFGRSETQGGRGPRMRESQPGDWPTGSMGSPANDPGQGGQGGGLNESGDTPIYHSKDGEK